MLVLEFIFRALPHIFRAKSIQPHPSKNGRYAYGSDRGGTQTLLIIIAAMDLYAVDRQQRQQAPTRPRSY